MPGAGSGLGDGEALADAVFGRGRREARDEVVAGLRHREFERQVLCLQIIVAARCAFRVRRKDGCEHGQGALVEGDLACIVADVDVLVAA